MPTLLHSVKSMRLFTGELHPTKLDIYDEYMVYIKRGIIRKNEATISYSHVSQVYLRKGYIASSIEIINTGGVENIIVNWLPVDEAIRAKRLIDQKVSHTHSRISAKEPDLNRHAPELERKMARLKELMLKGELSKSEFEKKRKEVLKSL